MLATPGDAHREWHLNANVPMGQPGCPQDACHLPDDLADYDEGPLVKCGACKGYHTVELVKAHYAAKYAAS